jgi:hypothetical protein
MQVFNEFSIEVLFDRRADGRYHIHSPNVPGLYLVGTDLHALNADVEPVVKDLLYSNRQMIVDTIRWVPSLDDVVAQFGAEPREGRNTFVVKAQKTA